jgi:peptidoglycan/LPS O-acetylase OafA/YrhL
LKKLKYIDSLRGLAILGVLLNHNLSMGNTSGKIPTVILMAFQVGALGVQLFFILSAFTLFLSFEQRIESESAPVKNYFIRRFFRIAPLFYLAIVYYLWQDGFGYHYWLGDVKEISLANIISNFTFTFGFNPYWLMSIVPYSWTIAVESVFYLFMPLFFYKVKSLNAALLFILGTYLIWSLLHFYLSDHIMISDARIWGSYLYFFLPKQLPIFGLGIFLFFVLKEKGEKLNPVVLLLLLTSLLVIYIGKSSGMKLFTINIEFILSITFAMLIYVLHHKPYQIFVNPITRYIGKVSYSIYLCHDAVIFFMRKFQLTSFISSTGKYDPLLDYFIRFGLLVILVTLLASITYYMVEVPGQNLGKRVIKLLENRKKKYLSSDLPQAQI